MNVVLLRVYRRRCNSTQSLLLCSRVFVMSSSTAQTTSGELRVLELFSGIGGMHYAFNYAGIPARFFPVDINDGASRMYENTFGGKVDRRNIATAPLRFFEGQYHDVWTMSPPCQPYTRQRSAKQKEAADTRNEALQRLLTVLRELQEKSLPQLVVVENVRHFWGSESCDDLLKVLQSRQFTINSFMITPRQIGFPNERTRTYILALRTDIPQDRHRDRRESQQNAEAEQKRLSPSDARDDKREHSETDELGNNRTEEEDCLAGDPDMPRQDRTSTEEVEWVRPPLITSVTSLPPTLRGGRRDSKGNGQTDASPPCFLCPSVRSFLDPRIDAHLFANGDTERKPGSSRVAGNCSTEEKLQQSHNSRPCETSSCTCSGAERETADALLLGDEILQKKSSWCVDLVYRSHAICCFPGPREVNREDYSLGSGAVGEELEGKGKKRREPRQSAATKPYSLCFTRSYGKYLDGTGSVWVGRGDLGGAVETQGEGGQTENGEGGTDKEAQGEREGHSERSQGEEKTTDARVSEMKAFRGRLRWFSPTEAARLMGFKMKTGDPDAGNPLWNLDHKDHLCVPSEERQLCGGCAQGDGGRAGSARDAGCVKMQVSGRGGEKCGGESEDVDQSAVKGEAHPSTRWPCLCSRTPFRFSVGSAENSAEGRRAGAGAGETTAKGCLPVSDTHPTSEVRRQMIQQWRLVGNSLNPQVVAFLLHLCHCEKLIPR
uniref:DNA (cytosine-5-)-methyltransferase n=1 Tax=Chromera velia CCMP2878 TaxID=1169474 RepID=A0A0G4I888_9ALVE|eukprot:Cvel_1975.t1-p1 / transcript=Cvel_1975.t1 / gene=Cvel_1975 / organism=Chromera_velia_CCMP2878 / gene_product=tRNA (cytosine(38)-C(5))-methyltransferase, putative / transcript_product=tRNA (cytosine(38)-C(5))-methyltransferase, putative / location=Cvel_scaffold75:33249-38020(+) / protein_length=718 / sequence_SO=supercontig / SO=protein_coding / is_pseudo=false